MQSYHHVALLLRLRRNPSAGTQERENVVFIWSLYPLRCPDTIAVSCASVHWTERSHSHSVNKAMQSGNNHTQTTTICLFVSACRSQWASLATDHTTLRKHNNIQHHGFKNKNLTKCDGVQPFVISLPLITFFFPLSTFCPSLSSCKWVIYQP